MPSISLCRVRCAIVMFALCCQSASLVSGQTVSEVVASIVDEHMKSLPDGFTPEVSTRLRNELIEVFTKPLTTGGDTLDSSVAREWYFDSVRQILELNFTRSTPEFVERALQYWQEKVEHAPPAGRSSVLRRLQLREALLSELRGVNRQLAAC